MLVCLQWFHLCAAGGSRVALLCSAAVYHDQGWRPGSSICGTRNCCKTSSPVREDVLEGDEGPGQRVEFVDSGVDVVET